MPPASITRLPSMNASPSASSGSSTIARSVARLRKRMRTAGPGPGPNTWVSPSEVTTSRRPDSINEERTAFRILIMRAPAPEEEGAARVARGRPSQEIKNGLRLGLKDNVTRFVRLPCQISGGTCRFACPVGHRGRAE